MISRFTKTPAEVEAFQRELSRARYRGQAIQIDFLSSEAFVQEILPPCFVKPEVPRGRIIIGSFRNPEFALFSTCSLNFACLYPGQNDEVWYPLAGVTDSNVPLILKREAWGENQKQGTAQIFLEPDAAIAIVKRASGLLLRARIDFEKNVADGEGSFHAVNIRGAIEKNGWGFEYGVDAVITKTVFKKTCRKSGAVELELFDTFLDKWAQIPVLQPGRAEFFTVEGEFGAVKTEAFESPEGYMPYILGAKYDNITHYTSFPDPRK
jgi:hypothetical protein